MRITGAKKVVLLILAAFAVRLAAGLWWQSRLPEGKLFAFGDSAGYWELARTIAAGEPYQFGSPDARVFRTPGYPILLAPLFLIAGPQPPVVLARALGAVLGTLAVVGVWWLAGRLFGPKAGWIAGGVAAAYPGAIITSVLVLSEGPFCPLMIVQIALWTVAWQSESVRRAAAFALGAGLVAGTATLVRPSWLLFTPGAILLGSVFVTPRRRQLALGAVMLAGLIVVLAPWWIRNAAVTGRFVPTTLQVGASLYDGLNPRATGASNMSYGDELTSSEAWLEKYRSADPTEPKEVRLDRVLRTAALRWALAHPGEVCRLAAVKFVRIWNVWPNEPSLRRPIFRLVVLCSYGPVLALGIVGAVRSFGRGWPYLLCWLPAVYFTMLHTIFVGSIRYRQPAMLGLMVLAAGAAAGWRGDAREETCP